MQQKNGFGETLAAQEGGRVRIHRTKMRRSEANFLFMVEKSVIQGLQINNDCYVVPKLVPLLFTLYI